VNEEVVRFENGVYRQNCYVVGDNTGNALIIDPGSDHQSIISLIEERQWRPKAILITHGHFDHIGAVSELRERYDIPFFSKQADAKLMRRANLYKLVVEPEKPIKPPAFDQEIVDVQGNAAVSDFDLSILETPGHTPGSVCIVIDRKIFTGDTVLPAGAGRIDLPGGNVEHLKDSIRKLAALGHGLTAYPGHGDAVPLEELLNAQTLVSV